MGTARYALEVYTEHVLAGERVLEGHRQIVGTLKPLEGLDRERFAEQGTPLTLRLEDGQHYDFFFETDGAVVTRQKGLYAPKV